MYFFYLSAIYLIFDWCDTTMFDTLKSGISNQSFLWQFLTQCWLKDFIASHPIVIQTVHTWIASMWHSDVWHTLKSEISLVDGFKLGTKQRKSVNQAGGTSCSLPGKSKFNSRFLLSPLWIQFQPGNLLFLVGWIITFCWINRCFTVRCWSKSC